MPLIKTYEKEEATGELAELYEQIIKTRGSLGNNAKLFSSSPEILKHQMGFIKYYMNHPTLSMPLLASIRILVSTNASCEFCVDYNTSMLVNMGGWTLEQVQAMHEDITKANLPKREIALLEFVIKSIKNAHSANEDDIEILHELQWSDKDILDAVNHAARMLATDIVFNTFKVDSYK